MLNPPHGEATLRYDLLRFLIIDDNAVMRTWLRDPLIRSGARHISMASTFDEALKHFKTGQTFDVVLCDYHLGAGRDGQQLLEEARRGHLVSPATVWIMVTGETQYQQIFSAAELLPDDYLLKPFKSDLLHTRIARALTRARALFEVNTLFFDQQWAPCITACRKKLEIQGIRYANEFRRICGEAMLRAGLVREAHAFFLDVIRSGINYPWARLGLARACFQLQQREQSLELLEALIADSPDFLQAHDWVARIQEETGRPEVAKEILSATLKKNPKALSRHREIVRVALACDDVGTALEAYRSMHLHGRGSCFVTPGDFSGYAVLISGQVDKQRVIAALKGLAANLRDFYHRNDHFAFARNSIDYFTARTKGNEAMAKQAYVAMQGIDGRQLDSCSRMAMLHAAVDQDDTATASLLAENLLLDCDGDRGMEKQVLSAFPAHQRDAVTKAARDASSRMRSAIGEAIALVRDGDYESAIGEFDHLTHRYPKIPVFYNAGVAVAKWIESGHCDIEKLQLLNRYITHIEGIDPGCIALKRLRDFQTNIQQFGTLAELSM